jgi:hypothetical protein
MDILVPYFLTGMAVVALGCFTDDQPNSVWKSMRDMYRDQPLAVALAVAISVALLSFFWPFVLWNILIRRKPS